MGTTVFHKLVRDKIPEIIAAGGAVPEIEILDDAEYIKMLDEKLLEECSEAISAKNIDEKLEEIADTIEVLYAMVEALGFTIGEMETVRQKKKEERGAFCNKIFLLSKTDEE